MRGYTAGRFALEIDGVSAGWIYSAEGGNRVAEVVTEKLPQEHHTRKHVAGLKYEDITIVCGIGMAKHFWHKLKASFDDNMKRLDGAIHICDYDGHITRTLEFHQAIGPRYQALDDASLIPLALIHQGKHLPDGRRPIRLLRQRVPGVHGEALDGQDPHAASAPAQIVPGVEGR